jgi:hypothetical protein
MSLLDVVNISDAADPLLNGDFVAAALGSDFCWCRLTTDPEASSGECVCTRIIYRFDEVMRAAPANSVIHLGPGIFETRGLSSLHYADFSQHLLSMGYFPKNGQKVRGSGIDVTVLKLVHAIDPLSQPSAMGGPTVTTVDRGIIEGNLLEVEYLYNQDDLRANQYQSKDVKYFNNRGSASKPSIRGYNKNTDRSKNEIEDTIHAALLLSL